MHASIGFREVDSHRKLTLGLDQVCKLQLRASQLRPTAERARRQRNATADAVATVGDALAILRRADATTTLHALVRSTGGIVETARRELREAGGCAEEIVATCLRAQRAVLGSGLSLERALAKALDRPTALAATRAVVTKRSNARVRDRHRLGRTLLARAHDPSVASAGVIQAKVAAALLTMPQFDLEPSERALMHAICEQGRGLRRITSTDARRRIADRVHATANTVGLMLTGQLAEAERFTAAVA
jgi:hypothetical protein